MSKSAIFPASTARASRRSIHLGQHTPQLSDTTTRGRLALSLVSATVTTAPHEQETEGASEVQES